ncbi:hypothetical protein [Mesorhizobium dulcispinae]|uniref:hypothetical protein n=1 Tax=Mesorhizobium dulcispinae TaxID=3072316 RepID=UPI002A242479|nr:hypothetical protein [Mesorhizobium sp. VK23D]MDX8522846.1 hypothetical protein [Mesorhizobium sp. VK23D]
MNPSGSGISAFDGSRRDRSDARNCRQPWHVLVALRLADDPSFELVDLTRQRLDLIGDFSQSQSSGFWQANVLLVPHDLDQRSHSRAEGGNNPQLRQMPAKRVDRLSLLSDQKGARPQHHGRRLLISRFDRNETHGLAGDGFADRFDVGGLRLAPFH